jgi:hypothetical protein
MQETGCYENYPAKVVIFSNLVSLLIYGISAYILSRFSSVLVIGYVLFILFLEFRLPGRNCRDCHYYGKTCAFGKGRLSRIFFTQGRPEVFNQKKITWKDIVPDFLVIYDPHSRRHTAPYPRVHVDNPHAHHSALPSGVSW